MGHLREWASLWMKEEPNVPAWAAAGLTVGAGNPDLLLVRFRPEARRLAGLDDMPVRLLARLKEGEAWTRERLAGCVRTTTETLDQALKELEAIGALAIGPRGIVMDSPWKTLLPEVVSVEAKASKWREAIHQAARNRVFSHQSFVALPLRLAEKVMKDEMWIRYQVGLLGVSPQGEVIRLLRAPIQVPLVWIYHYHVAQIIANTEVETPAWNSMCLSKLPNASSESTNSWSASRPVPKRQPSGFGIETAALSFA